MRRAKNVSFDGRPIEIVLNSPFLVLLDPLALDGLRADFQSLAGLQPVERAVIVRGFLGPMRIGVHVIKRFRAGRYRVAPSDLEAIDDEVADSDVCDVDSGAIVVVDIGKLNELARILTWERYDFALQSPLEDDSRFLALVDELGGPSFGLLYANEGSAFGGDGSYRFREGTPLLVSG